jgi:hypothetical protein
MANMRSKVAPIKPHPIPAMVGARVTIFIDTIEVFFPSFPRKPVIAIRKLRGRRMKLVKVRDHQGHVRGYRIALNQPDAGTIRLLDTFVDRARASMCRVDFAFDIQPSVGSVAELAGQLQTKLVLKWRPAQELRVIGATKYWRSWSPGQKRPSANLLLYHDRPARMPQDQMRQVVHLELRLLNAGALRRAHIDRPADLIAFDAVNLLNRRSFVMNTDHLEVFVWKIVRRTLRDERAAALRRRRPSSAFMDRYRAGLPKRLWHQLRERIGLDTAQGYRDLHPSAAARQHRHPVIISMTKPPF